MADFDIEALRTAPSALVVAFTGSTRALGF
jgi:hypothetical protein